MNWLLSKRDEERKKAKKSQTRVWSDLAKLKLSKLDLRLVLFDHFHSVLRCWERRWNEKGSSGLNTMIVKRGCGFYLEMKFEKLILNNKFFVEHLGWFLVQF